MTKIIDVVKIVGTVIIVIPGICRILLIVIIVMRQVYGSIVPAFRQDDYHLEPGIMHIMTCRISLNLTAFYILSIVIETGHIADISSVITGE